MIRSLPAYNRFAFAPRLYNPTLLRNVVGVLAILGIWQGISLLYPSYLLPGPVEVAHTFLRLLLQGEIEQQLWPTVYRTVAGYSVATVLGIGLGIAMGSNKYLLDFTRVPVTIVMAIPGLSWAFLAVIWFGLTEASPIFVIFVITLPIALVNTLKGVQQVDRRLVEMARTHRAPYWMIVRDVYLPSILPYIFSALTVSMAFAWKIAIIAEMLGSSSGLGYAMLKARDYIKTDEVFVWTLVFVFLFLIVDNGIFRTIERMIVKWQ